VPVRVVATPYGRAAAEALRAEIARAKASSPLAPVTVIVPGNSVGVATRRLLASGKLGPVSPAGAGVIGVAFRTGFQLAELLAAPSLAAAGRRPVSTAVVAAAIRRVLATDPGPLFASVAAHPATEEALVGAHRELADLDTAALDVLAAQTRRAHEVVRIHRLVKEQLASAWYDEHDLMRAAEALVDAGVPLVAELGAILVHLPQRVSPPLARLLAALAAGADVVVIAGLAGVPKADAEVVGGVRRMGGALDPPPVVAAAGTAVCSTSDADDEVRLVVRGIVDAMRNGVPLERMAVVIGSKEPYARLLHDHLELAGIVHNGVSVRTLADSVLGRGLLRLLALPDHDFRRDDVFALLAGAPVLDGHGREAPAVNWERISRDAGIVRGIDEWHARLTRYAASLADSEDDPTGWADRERARAGALDRFVRELARDLAAPPASWAELARWTHDLVARWIGNEAARDEWSEFEQEAARRVEAAIDRLGGLDAVESSPTLDVFRRSLALELDAARDRIGRLGEGVFVGSAALALGVELDRVWACGLAEGVFPAPPADDPLIADADRQALNGELPLRRGRVGEDHRALLAVLAATAGERTLCFPRGDLRRNTEHVPSRFLLDTVEALSGRRVIEAATEAEPWFTFVPSYVYGLAHAPFPPTRHELDVRAALAGDPRLAAEPAIARSTALASARRGAAFTRFDGNLSELAPVLSTRSPARADVAISATRLETWAKCPHAYFARYLLHLKAVERPEELVQLSPLDKGNIVHETLDRFLAEEGHDGAGRPWTSTQRARLHALLADACNDIEARGLGGKRLLWARARRELHAQIDTFLDCDAGYRITEGADTLATELGFGRGSVYPAVEIALSDGRAVRMTGSIDRVDRLGDGRLAVIDYKTGSAKNYATVSHDTPLRGGELLQLPIYAHAARALLGEGSTAPVSVAYWFVLREPGKPRRYDFDAEVEGALDAALRVIIDGIDAGHFPARPPEPGWAFYTECEYCDPDGLGTTDTHRAWVRKRDDAELADYVALVGESEGDG
jgi:RecB family exonuclease